VERIEAAGRPVLPDIAPLPTALKPARSARLPALDATRGFAMVFVCLSHFVWSAIQVLGQTTTFAALMTVSMIASPTFILVSGITLGYVRAANRQSYPALARKLHERGILLLTVVHWAMVPSFRYMAPANQALRVLPITDTIGVCILLGPWMVARVNRVGRIVIAASLFALTSIAVLSVPPESSAVVRIIEGALFGFRGSGWWFYSFPVVPWFAFYLIGTVIGEALSAPEHASRSHFSVVLLKWAAGFVIVGLAIEILGVLISRLSAGGRLASEIVELTANPFNKLPPTPAYLMTFGTAALAMAALTAMLIERNRLVWLTTRAREIGRASLVIFVVQSYLYYFLELHWLPPRPFWPAWFLASLVIVQLTARLWLSVGGNDLLRVPGMAWYRAHATLLRQQNRT
jgi:uncharacterized membrane protein